MKRKEQLVPEEAKTAPVEETAAEATTAEATTAEETIVKKPEKKALPGFLDTLRTALVLLLVTGITVTLLAVVNRVTEGPIEALRQKELDETIAAMFPANGGYVEVGDADLPGTVKTLYAINNANGEVKGFVAVTATMGFGGEVEMLVGVDMEENVVGVKITEDEETVTKVAPIKEGDYLEKQYVGKTGPFSFSKMGGEIDAVSGSTISSTAVLGGVNAATEAVDTYLVKKGAK